jgi:hypothetical protein
MNKVPLKLCTAICVLLAGCSTSGNRSATLPEGRCRAAGAAALLGQPMSDQNAEAARFQSGAARFRIVRYRGPEGGDVDPLRLNIEVDERGVIQRLRCG